MKNTHGYLSSLDYPMWQVKKLCVCVHACMYVCMHHTEMCVGRVTGVPSGEGMHVGECM